MSLNAQFLTALTYKHPALPTDPPFPTKKKTTKPNLTINTIFLLNICTRNILHTYAAQILTQLHKCKIHSKHTFICAKNKRNQLYVFVLTEFVLFSDIRPTSRRSAVFEYGFRVHANL